MTWDLERLKRKLEALMEVFGERLEVACRHQADDYENYLGGVCEGINMSLKILNGSTDFEGYDDMVTMLLKECEDCGRQEDVVFYYGMSLCQHCADRREDAS